ncbi:MAG: GNAT family N-acetyltransferase [Firmicutes bacterium]|nr:GNAT family N-acetyltransferase [Bacillota bacterium]
MIIRPANVSDLPDLMQLFDEARGFMRAHGNMNQWVGGYPQEELLRSDIASGCSYVCEEDNQIVASFYFRQGVDPTYLEIEGGAWLNDEPYGVIHRIASRAKGAATFCVQWCAGQVDNLRIDTHRDNYVMQNFVKKNGFSYCGIIHLENGDERLAYQRRKV